MNWTVQMEYSRDGASDICFPGREDGAKPRPPEAAVPVEHFPVAAGLSCLAQSCHIVLGARGEEPRHSHQGHRRKGREPRPTGSSAST